MKIVSIVIGRLGIHGPSLIRLQIAAELAKRGYKVHIVIAADSVGLADSIPDGCEIFVLHAGRPRDFILKCGSYLREHRPDAVLASSWPYSVATIIATRLFSWGTPIVVSEHVDFRTNIEISGEFTRKDCLLIKHFAKYVYNFASKVVGVSQGVVDGLIEMTGLNRSKTMTIHNPLRRMREASLAGDRELGLRDAFWGCSSAKLLAVGRLASQKNYEVMIDAVALLAKKFEVKLIIVGEGSMRSVLQRRIEECSLMDTVLLAGETNNIGAYYSMADVFIMSSSSEGFGNVIVEALSFGLRIVSTDCQSGPAEILDYGEYGVLTPVGDPQAFALGVEKALALDVDRAKQVARSKDFSIEKATDQYLSALFSH